MENTFRYCKIQQCLSILHRLNDLKSYCKFITRTIKLLNQTLEQN